MNNTGVLQIESQGNSIVIREGADKIRRNRMAKLYMRSNLKFSDCGDHIQVEITENVNVTMNHIKVLTKYINCDISFGEGINREMQNFRTQESLFEEFSQQARNIRDNHPQIDEFKRFEESLIKNMPNRQLYKLQMLSAYHMAVAQNACNFSVPGAGKTSVVYGAYAYLHNLPKDDPKHVNCIVIIGPLSSFGPWEIEYKECFGTEPTSMRLIGGMTTKEKSLYLHGMSHADITLTSYQSIISIKDDLLFFLSQHKAMVVLDEAHKIKNTHGGIMAASTMELASKAASRVVLTGTPAPNGYEDLYNLFHFIWPDRDVLTYNVPQLVNMSHSSEDERVDDLINKIAPFFIRVRKSDLNIPPASFEEIEVEMSDSQKSIYNAIENKFMAEIDEDMSPFLKKVRKAKFIRLMQVATNPELLNSKLTDIDDVGEDIAESEEDSDFIAGIKQFVSSEVPNKFIKAADIAEEIVKAGGKVVIWASFIRNIERMSEYLKERGIASRMLYGATPVEASDGSDEMNSLTRESIVREFNRDDSSFRVILANPFAVAESISLHKKCHNAIYIERSFNAAHFIQSKDRIHRYGLKPDVNTKYYYLISKDTIDETINKRLAEKEQRLNDIMESMPIPLFDNVLESGGIDDVKAILRDYEARAKKI